MSSRARINKTFNPPVDGKGYFHHDYRSKKNRKMHPQNAHVRRYKNKLQQIKIKELDFFE